MINALENADDCYLAFDLNLMKIIVALRLKKGSQQIFAAKRTCELETDYVFDIKSTYFFLHFFLFFLISPFPIFRQVFIYLSIN